MLIPPGPRDVDDTISWREQGSGDPVLFLHGLGGSRIAWETQLRDLSPSYRCIAWDMPGYGASQALAGGLTWPGLADAVARLLDTLGAGRAHLVGLSMGGMVAMHAALRHPARVRSLALLETSPAFGFDGVTAPESWLEARLAPLGRGVTPAAMAPTVLRGVAGPQASEEVISEAALAMARIPSEALADACRCLTTHDVRARLGDITAPTLVVVGELDSETPLPYAEAIAAGIAGARLEVVPGAGHLVNLERPDETNRLLAAHLEGIR